MLPLTNHVDEKIVVEISGKVSHKGILVDAGSDLIVIYNGEDFIYIPSIHIQKINKGFEDDEYIDLNSAGDSPIVTERDDRVSLRKILINAKGLFSEIFVTGNQSIHGYVTSMLSDYFVFYSPVYKTMFIPIKHLKWLIPYTENRTPYSLTNQDLPVKPSEIGLSRTFEIQLEKLKKKIVVFDLGHDTNKIGQLKSIEGNIVEMITAREESVLLNMQHIKTVHFP